VCVCVCVGVCVMPKTCVHCKGIENAQTACLYNSVMQAKI